MSVEKDILKKFLDYKLSCGCGEIIGEAYITDCILVTEKFSQELLKENPMVYGNTNHVMKYAWKLENVKKYDFPIRVKGKLGLWNYEE